MLSQVDHKLVLLDMTERFGLIIIIILLKRSPVPKCLGVIPCVILSVLFGFGEVSSNMSRKV